MANPNIAAMTELNVGTLAWEIVQDGVSLIWGNVYAEYSGTQAGQKSRSSPLTPEVWKLRDGDYTLQNTLMVAHWCYQGNTAAISSADYDNQAGTQISGAYHQWTPMYTAGSDMWYWTDSQINHTSGTNPSTKNLDGNYDYGSYGTVQYGSTVTSAYLANVDQTNPFTNIRANYPVWTTSQSAGNRNPPFFEPIPTQIGDMVIVCFGGIYGSRVQLRNANSHLIGSVANSNGTTWYCNAAHMSYINPRSYEEHVMQQVENGYIDQISGGGSESQNNTWSVINVQSPRTKTTLFEVPSGKVIKLNNLYIENPEIAGLYVSIDIEGMPTGTTGILDSSGAKVINSEGTIATTTICKMLRAKSGNAVPAMKRPMILTEGDVVKAKVVADESYPEWLNKSCQIVADFEIIT